MPALASAGREQHPHLAQRPPATPSATAPARGRAAPPPWTSPPWPFPLTSSLISSLLFSSSSSFCLSASLASFCHVASSWFWSHYRWSHQKRSWRRKTRRNCWMKMLSQKKRYLPSSSFCPFFPSSFLQHVRRGWEEQRWPPAAGEAARPPPSLVFLV